MGAYDLIDRCEYRRAERMLSAGRETARVGQMVEAMYSRQLRQFAPPNDGPAKCVACGTVVVNHMGGSCPMCHHGRMEGV